MNFSLPLVIGRCLSSCPLSQIVVIFIGEEVSVMAKTDKELATEITCTCITAWFSKPNCSALNGDDISAIFNEVYKTIHLAENESK